MGFFTKKKGERKEGPPLKLPAFPSEFPKYESEVSHDETMAIKDAIKPGEIPIRKPSAMLSQTFNAPIQSPVSQTPVETNIKREKTLFVKIDKYKEIMKTLDRIKDKVGESGKILEKLNTLKQEEDRELKTWHQDLEELKQKLLEVNDKLFEE